MQGEETMLVQHRVAERPESKLAQEMAAMVAMVKAVAVARVTMAVLRMLDLAALVA